MGYGKDIQKAMKNNRNICDKLKYFLFTFNPTPLVSFYLKKKIYIYIYIYKHIFAERLWLLKTVNEMSNVQNILN